MLDLTLWEAKTLFETRFESTCKNCKRKTPVGGDVGFIHRDGEKDVVVCKPCWMEVKNDSEEIPASSNTDYDSHSTFVIYWKRFPDSPGIDMYSTRDSNLADLIIRDLETQGFTHVALEKVAL